jgi:hypothetical protein
MFTPIIFPFVGIAPHRSNLEFSRSIFLLWPLLYSGKVPGYIFVNGYIGSITLSHCAAGFNDRITDCAQGFGYGFYDGISGLVTQPMKGAEKEGAAGFLKGIGRGIGGLVLKPGAGK